MNWTKDTGNTAIDTSILNYPMRDVICEGEHWSNSYNKNTKKLAYIFITVVVHSRFLLCHTVTIIQIIQSYDMQSF